MSRDSAGTRRARHQMLPRDWRRWKVVHRFRSRPPLFQTDSGPRPAPVPVDFPVVFVARDSSSRVSGLDRRTVQTTFARYPFIRSDGSRSGRTTRFGPKSWFVRLSTMTARRTPKRIRDETPDSQRVSKTHSWLLTRFSILIVFQMQRFIVRFIPYGFDSSLRSTSHRWTIFSRVQQNRLNICRTQRKQTFNALTNIGKSRTVDKT